ncbi:MAG: AraC family transcriptional regulator [Alphaproteobacteria bacterium]|nr:AraC family transcriptional regulator [Alphaproteobacteria bacterium]
MDALSDVLRVVGLTGGIFLDARFTAPWCITGQVGPESCAPFMAPPARIVCFHFVVEGSCLIDVKEAEPVRVEQGEAVLLPRNELHRLGSDLKAGAISAADIIQPPEGVGVPRIIHGGGGDACTMVCGFLGGDAQLEPLLATLPPLLKLKVRDTPGGEWIAQSFRFGAQQLANGDPGAATIMSKMSELLFIEAVRRYLTTMPEAHTGFLAGLRDAAVGKALALMHTQVARAWTAEDLAGAVNLSRSAFADRFTTLMGQPPMTYLTNWRMQVAAHKLREGRLTIGQIAFDVGYESEAAFTRAFKRELGVPPATWRKQIA